MKLTSQHAVWAFLLMLVVSVPAVAQEGRMVLGPDGTILRLLNGSYGELFPTGAAAEPGNPVLALEILASDGTVERQLVPGTASQDPEGAEILVLDEGRQVIYLLWEGLWNGIHPLLQLTSYSDGVWSEVIEIASGPFADKGAPQLVITRETADGTDIAQAELDRTVLHVTWWQEASGISRKLYAPIIIEGGERLEQIPVLDTAFFTASQGDDTAILPVDEFLSDALSIHRGTDSRSVVLGFLDSRTHLLRTLAFDVMPRALSDLSDKVRAEIVLIGNKEVTRSDLALQISAAVHQLAADFHVSSRNYMAARLRRVVETSEEALTPEGLELLSDKVRAEIVLIGSSIDDSGLATPGEGLILEFGNHADGSSRHLLKVTPVFERVAPSIGNAEGPAQLFLSETGRNMLVTWESEGRIFYVQSLEEGWTEPSFIQPSRGLDRGMIYQMLEQRVRDH